MKAYIPREFKVRTLREAAPMTATLDSPEQVVAYWRQNIETADWYDPMKEALVVLVLNTRKRVMGHNLVALGNLDTCPLHAREVFRPVICAAGSSLVLAHNHPSGEAVPSESDIRVTRDLIRAGQLLKLELLDHVIVGANQHGSLRELGYFYQ